MKVVAAAVIRRAGLVLIGRRPAGESMGGLWEFPGGKIRPGETPEECLARELEEELGVRAEIGRLFCTGRHGEGEGEIRLLVFDATIVSGEPEARFHAELRWASAAGLREYPFPPADLPALELLASGDSPA